MRLYEFDDGAGTGAGTGTGTGPLGKPRGGTKNAKEAPAHPNGGAHAMSEMSLPVVEKTVHKTRLWLDDVMAAVETTDRSKAFRALRAVLHAVRDQLQVMEAVGFAAQMPLLVRGLYYEGWKPAAAKRGTVSEFLDRVGEEFGEFSTLDLERVSRSVFRVIGAHISLGEMRDVLQSLPPDVRDFLVADQYRARCEPLLRAHSDSLQGSARH